jgi:pyruvate/2-oxoglutarate dehydrogenase complex dihydrolipoamide acyltransferase (E2) component
LKEAELIRWCVEEGGQAVAFEPLCELQFDKAAQEISSPYTGWLAVARIWLAAW